MATQASMLYATNIRHMLTDLTPEKDGAIVHNMEDDDPWVYGHPRW